MALSKLEGIYSDIIVIFYGGRWYGIPFSQLVQLDCVQKKYGLVVTAITLQDDDIAGNTLCPDADEILADRVVQLRKRYEALAGEPVEDLRELIDRYPAQFTDVLSSTLIP